MSSPSAPQDNSLAVEQAQEAASTKAQAAADAKTAQDKADLAALRTSSAGNATNSVDNYFKNQGLDPTQYSGDIQQQIQDIMSGIDPTDPNPGSSFNNAGVNIYNNLTSNAQTRAGNSLDSVFSPNYSSSKVTNDLVNPEINTIAGEQYQSADDIINNMLKRGVINQSGKSAAEAELQRQQPGVLSQLNTIGSGTVASEQQSLDDIANKARQNAATTKLGQTFDPSVYGNEADSQFNDFLKNLDTTVRGKVTGNLFNTTGLAAIAGAGQGAGNTAYNPTAAAGIIDPNDDTNTTPKDTSSNSSANFF